MLLEIKELSVYYGFIQALKGISFSVEKGEIVALIGANGAGKTTTLHTISGLISPKGGEILFNGKDISKLPGQKRVSMGIAQVPEGRRVFADMTVEENLKMGAYTRTDRSEVLDSMEEVFNRFPRLKERRNQVSGTLSGGEQQMLAMGRALMSKPDILLLDEPAAGMNPNETAELMDTISLIRDKFDMTILLIEHDMRLVSGICECLTVLNFGQVLAEGETKDVLKRPEVIRAYLGDED